MPTQHFGYAPVLSRHGALGFAAQAGSRVAGTQCAAAEEGDECALDALPGAYSNGIVWLKE